LDKVLAELGVTKEQAYTSVDLNRTVRDRTIRAIMEYAKEAAGLSTADEISEANQSYIYDFIDMTLSADAMEPPTPTRSQTLDSNFSVETSNRFEGIDGFADGITKTVDETAAFACDRLHCTGEHFYGKGAKKAYARHIETKHEGPLNETETHAGMWQCATCGKVTYTTERSAKSHQTDCASRTTEEQARRRTAVKGSRASRAKRANRKWQPNFGKRKHSQLNLDLNDRITDAHIKAFFGPMSLKSPEFSSMTGKTIRQIPREAQHAWATVCAAAAKRVLSDLGNEEYAMLFISLPRLCLQFPSREKQKAGISTASQVLERISAVLGGDFGSFEMEQDDRPKGPQGTAGVIDENVARRIKECVRQDCISQALKAGEQWHDDGYT
jgi:hypothetical protein